MVSIRRAHTGDAAGLAELSAITFVEAFGENYPSADLTCYLARTYTVEAYRAFLESPEHHLWVAVDEGEMVGYLLAGPCSLPHGEVAAEDREIKRFYVRSSHQNCGVGTALFETALRCLLSAGPRTLWLGVWSQNPRAQRFYRRYGFDRVGEYFYEVGATWDFEFIFRRPAGDLGGQGCV